MFVKLTDLKGHPIFIRADNIERVRWPVAGEYPPEAGAVLMMVGGSAQAVKELPEAVTRVIAGPLKYGGNPGGPVL